MSGYVYIPRVHHDGRIYREDLYKNDVTGKYIAVDKTTGRYRIVRNPKCLKWSYY